MNYKRLIPCIFIYQGKAVKWFDNLEILSDDVVKLAKKYNDMGADELLVFDLSTTDEEHDHAIDLMKKMNRVIRIPMVAGGNIRRQEDVKKILYTGAKRAILNFSKALSVELIEDVSKRFGKEKIAVSLNDFDALFKQQHLIEECSSSILFMHRLDLDSVMNITDIPSVVLTDAMEEEEILQILKCPGIKGVSGKFISQPDLDFAEFKKKCSQENIKMTSFESIMEFTEFKLNSDGLIPVIVQNYKTGEVLMLAYMNEEAFDHTIKTGKMTYYSRSRKTQWVKGETSGHYQYVKSLTIDCDRDTLLAKVDQVGPACHTGNPTCFFQPLVGTDYDETNPLQVFETVYETIVDRKKNPKEGSYTNYLFDKGIDKILKKVGEEATELVIAAKNPNPEEVKYELSDFLYHAMVLMVERGVTWEDIIKELEKPGRDPRDEMPKPILRKDVLDMKDLTPGMILKGTVRNVIDFGAFVDIGVHQDGLVHISQMSSTKRVEHPLDVVSVGDVVDVRVIDVDIPKARISLSMILDEKEAANRKYTKDNSNNKNNRNNGKGNRQDRKPKKEGLNLSGLAKFMH